MKYLNKKMLILTLLAGLFLLSSCRNPNDQPTTENEITEGGETIISEITSEESTTTSETTSATTESATTDTSAATEEPITTEPPETEPPEPETTTSVSETAESQTTATTTEQTTITAEETTVEAEETTVTELEVEDDLYNMPEIVFILDYRYTSNNTVTLNITKDGHFKYYNFSENEPDAIHAFSNHDDYNMLKEICVDTGLDPMPKDDLIKLYEMLLVIDKDSELVYWTDGDMYTYPQHFGIYWMYGARLDSKDELEIIPLGGYGDATFYNSDPNSNELLETLKETFPRPNNFN